MGDGTVSPIRRTQERGTAPIKTPAERLAEALSRGGVRDAAVLGAMSRVPRHEFVDEAFKARAYETQSALPIGFAQTISQPLVVGMMTQALLEGGRKRQRVLEVGTGSGYQTAVLAELCEVVFTVERVKALTELARKRLAGLRYRNVHFGYADGMQGWLPYAPYDGIIVTAAAAELPQGLLEQLSPGGRLVIPVGPQGGQVLKVIDRGLAGFKQQDIATVSFVPLLAGKV
jgi:protein-L-isoaspartate(D-aspartate) O-methyltransferase